MSHNPTNVRRSHVLNLPPLPSLSLSQCCMWKHCEEDTPNPFNSFSEQQPTFHLLALVGFLLFIFCFVLSSCAFVDCVCLRHYFLLLDKVMTHWASVSTVQNRLSGFFCLFVCLFVCFVLLSDLLCPVGSRHSSPQLVTADEFHPTCFRPIRRRHQSFPYHSSVQKQGAQILLQFASSPSSNSGLLLRLKHILFAHKCHE